MDGLVCLASAAQNCEDCLRISWRSRPAVELVSRSVPKTSSTALRHDRSSGVNVPRLATVVTEDELDWCFGVVGFFLRSSVWDGFAHIQCAHSRTCAAVRQFNGKLRIWPACDPDQVVMYARATCFPGF